eukprot:m.73588 g.73588  ORF g.73588 m.73588 type:complete len:204 (+) comp14336_c0_seq1:213-824(+)
MPEDGFRGCWQGIDISGSGLVASLLSVLSIAFYAVGLGTDHWIESDKDDQNLFDVEMGLFQFCERRCSAYVDNEFRVTGQNDLNLVTRTEATAAFVSIGLALSFLTIVLVIFSLGREGYNNTVSQAAVCAFTAGCSGLVAMAIFAKLHTDLSGRSFDLAYSFILVAIAWVLNLLAAVLLLVDSRNISYRSASDAARSGGAGMI